LVIVDSTVWVDYLNGFDTRYTAWLDEQLERQRLGLTDLILCEVLQGIRDDMQAARVREELLEFEILTMGGIALAVTAAQNYRLLRARGRTVRKTTDCLIATFCLLNDHELIHNDRDFDSFEQVLKLQVIHP
jgi:predicted nucleic acid-binding protein